MAPSDRLAILDRPLYSLPEAARLLQIPTATLRRWLEGGAVKGVEYPPVIRQQPTGSTDVTWAEFVEAGFLREYRRSREVSLQRLRPFVDVMRSEGFPYPLAHFKPYVLGDRGKLLIELARLQAVSGLPTDLALVEWETGQLVAREPLRAFLLKVEFDPDDGVARRLYPLGRDGAVVIEPGVAFGVPQIRGVRTELLAEAFLTGETEQELSDTYGLTRDEVSAAVRWEFHLHRRTAHAA